MRTAVELARGIGFCWGARASYENTKTDAESMAVRHLPGIVPAVQHNSKILRQNVRLALVATGQLRVQRRSEFAERPASLFMGEPPRLAVLGMAINILVLAGEPTTRPRGGSRCMIGSYPAI